MSPAYHSGNLKNTDRPWYNYPFRPTVGDRTKPLAPRNIMVTSPYHVDKIDVRWDNPKIIPQNSGLDILGCNVYRSTDNPYGPYVKVNDNPITVLFYRDQSVEDLVMDEDATPTLKHELEPRDRWLVYSSQKPIIIPGSNGQVTNRVEDVVVKIDDGDGLFLEVPAFRVNGPTGEIELIREPTYSYELQQIIPPRLPTQPNGRVRISYKYLKHSVLTVLNQRIYYKVTSVAVDPDDSSATIETPLEEISDRSAFDVEAIDYIWREAILRNRWLLEQGGERVKIFIRKWMGETCPSHQINYGQSYNDCHVCFPAGQEVTMFDGCIRNIEDIKKNDKVLTMDGLPSKVMKTFKREHNENLISIESYGKDPISCTMNHPFLVLRKEDSFCIKYKKTYNKNKCVPMLKNICFRDKNPCSHKLKYSWVDAKDLKEGDYLLVPKIKSKKLNKFSEEEMFLFGIYMAEGSLHFRKQEACSVSIGLGSHEKSLINLVRHLFLKVYNKEASIYENKKKHGTTLSFYGKEIAKKFIENCGKGSHSKRLSEEVINSSDELVLSLLRGYIMGDGCLNKRKGFQYTTVSINMASQLELLLARIGIPSTAKKYFHVEKRTGWGESHWFHLGRAGSYHAKKIGLLFDKKTNKEIKKKQHKILNFEDFIGHPIKKIKKVKFTGFVYNLEIDRNNTYLVKNVVVHNCYGTNYVGGYEGPFDVIIAPPESEKMVELADMGLHIRYDWASWTGSWPLINARDVIIRQNNERYVVGPVTPQGSRGCIYQQHFSMSYIDQGDIRYQIDIPGGADEVPASYSACREPQPTPASPMINDKPEIVPERSVRGRTITFENITW